MIFFSVLASALAASLFTMIYNRAKTTKMDRMNVYALAEITIFVFWIFCDAFFYNASTKEWAWFWHRLTSFGAIGYVVGAANYYFVMTGFSKKVPFWLKIIYFAIPALFTIKCLVGGPTAFATDIVPSKWGLGWTYVNSFTDLWSVLYFIYTHVYLSVALVVLYKWLRTAPHQMAKKFGSSLFRLVICCAWGGFTSVYIITIGQYFPPIPCVPLFAFGFIVWNSVKSYDFSYVQEALDNGYIYENCIGAMLITDDTHTILYSNHAICNLCGAEDLVGKNVFDIFSDSSAEKLKGKIEKSEAMSAEEYSLKNSVPVICSRYQTQNKSSKLDLFLLHFNDITALKEATERLNYLANFDELTGLSNRRMVMNRLFEMEESYRKTGLDFELVFLDLTKFKYINDTFGHDAGDEALRAVAEVLKKNTPEADLAARFAGDEFMVIHIGESTETIENLRREIQAIDTSAFAPGFNMNAGIGSCKYSEAMDVEALIKEAETRMYKDK